MIKRVLRGRMINGIVFGLSTPDRHKNRGNLHDILKDVAPYQGPTQDPPKQGRGTVQITGTKPSLLIIDELQLLADISKLTIKD